MSINDFFSRFKEVRGIYIGKNLSISRKIFYYIDWLFAYIIHGASISDYFAYGFYKLRYNGRKEYVTYRRYRTIQSICNKPSDISLCRDKIEFNQHFRKFLGRNWIDLKNVSLLEFVDFCNSYPYVFCKEIYGFRGIGTKKISIKNENLKQLYETLINDSDSHYIVEEPIFQVDSLTEFHPWSINTIRVVTVYDNKNDYVHIMHACLRIGNHKNAVDNLHYGGIGANIDIETGIITSIGFDSKNRTYLKHPITGKQIVGFHIPYWNECKEFVVSAAKELPTIRYIGWDVVIQNNGSFVLIEGNDNADHDLQQLYNQGLWKQYKSIIKGLR